MSDPLVKALVETRLLGTAALVNGQWVLADAVSVYYQPVGNSQKAYNVGLIPSKQDPVWAAQFPRNAGPEAPEQPEGTPV